MLCKLKINSITGLLLKLITWLTGSSRTKVDDNRSLYTDSNKQLMPEQAPEGCRIGACTWTVTAQMLVTYLLMLPGHGFNVALELLGPALALDCFLLCSLQLRTQGRAVCNLLSQLCQLLLQQSSLSSGIVQQMGLWESLEAHSC